MTPLIEVKDLGFKYPQSMVLDKIDFTVGQGEIFCLLGPNGSGKTTLLDCVLGWLKPSKGQVLINGVPLMDMTAKQIARNMAYVPQVHEKTFPYQVKDIVLMGRASFLGPFSTPSPEDEAIAEQSLNMVGIAHLQDRPYTQLSGGEGQLVMVARALAQNTPLIIMDEPTAHLDYHHELMILETIVKLIKETGLSILMATHIPNHCFYFENQGIACQAAMLRNKHFETVGKASEVLSEPGLGKLYHIKASIIDCMTDNGKKLKQVIPISTIDKDIN